MLSANDPAPGLYPAADCTWFLCYAAGEAVWEQMELDMFRMAALYVVERLKPQLFSYLTAVLSAANPAPSRSVSCLCCSKYQGIVHDVGLHRTALHETLFIGDLWGAPLT